MQRDNVINDDADADADADADDIDENVYLAEGYMNTIYIFKKSRILTNTPKLS